MTNLPGLYDKYFYRNVGTSKKRIYSLKQDDKNVYWGYDENSFPQPAGWLINNLENNYSKSKQKYQYIIINEDKDIIQKYPNSMIWRNMTKEEIEDEIVNNTTVLQFGASDRSEEHQRNL